MVGIPAGRFLMGSPKTEPGRFNSEEPQHAISTKPFALGKYDITTAQFIAFLKSTSYRPAPSNRKTARWWGDAIGVGKANCNGCGSPFDDRLLAAVEAFAPNPFGLYGMLGNAWQWTADCWHANYLHAPDDGSAWVEKSCAKHVVRGGSWNSLPALIRSASRSFSTGDGGDYDYSSLAGFRVARDLP